MAAAYMAVRHVQGLEAGDCEKVEVVHKMPGHASESSEKIIKEGVLSRQIMSSAGILYTKRDVVLTQKCLYFGKVGSGDVLDWIPLLEIKHGTEEYHLRGLESPHVSRRSVAGNTSSIKNLYHNPSDLFHLGVDLDSDSDHSLRVAKAVRLANDKDRRAWLVRKQLNMMQKDWRICEVDCRHREIVNKKVPQMLEFNQADEDSVHSPAKGLTEDQMFAALEAPGHKRLRFDDLSHIIQDSESSRVTLKFHSSSNQKSYDLCFVNMEDRDDFLSVLKRNIQDLDIVDTGEGKTKQALIKTSSYRRNQEQTDRQKLQNLFFNQNLTMVVETIQNGHNHGRSTILMARDENEKAEWRSCIESAVQEAHKRRESSRDK